MARRTDRINPRPSNRARKFVRQLCCLRTEYMDTRSGVVPYTVANPPVVSTVNASGLSTLTGRAAMRAVTTIRVVQFE
jgi:hypothetical protein